VVKSGREQRDRIAAPRVLANIEEKSPQSRQFAIRQLSEHRRVLPPVHEENAEIERLE